MNKHQDALDIIFDKCADTFYIDNEIETLQKLVDRATPMKLIKHKFVNDDGENLIQKKCPNNHSFVGRANYCPNCGQALDWSEDND